MAGRSHRRLWRQVTVGCCLAWATTSLAGAAAARHVTSVTNSVVRPSLRLLQLNLCDSGLAGCYTGRSVREAAEVIRAARPDIVTLNEVCRDDVSVLESALSDSNHGAVVASAFEAAVDRRTRGAFRCSNGQPYGIGLLARVRPPPHGYRTYGEVYPIQDTGDPEQRVWLCLHAIAGFYACTTHLASTSTPVALAQCGNLLYTVIPAMRTQGGPDPLVLGGDLNLRSVCSPGAQSRLTPGYRHAGDGATQHIVATTDLTVRSTRLINMHGTTDHPGLLVDLAIIPPPMHPALPVQPDCWRGRLPRNDHTTTCTEHSVPPGTWTYVDRSCSRPRA
jgi:endonuclease/exonuclease/phosphatase family metal-dependent hydrolase